MTQTLTTALPRPDGILSRSLALLFAILGNILLVAIAVVAVLLGLGAAVVVFGPALLQLM